MDTEVIAVVNTLPETNTKKNWDFFLKFSTTLCSLLIKISFFRMEQVNYKRNVSPARMGGMYVLLELVRTTNTCFATL